MQVIEHYENPRNVGSLDAKNSSVGTGLVGSPACGDLMKMQVCKGMLGMFLMGDDVDDDDDDNNAKSR